MLDLLYIGAAIAVFVVVGRIAKGVERLGPPAGGRTTREAMHGEERG
ncbi:hypothetical protein ACDF64_06605 [Agromyces sp. MMS24-JH15]